MNAKDRVLSILEDKDDEKVASVIPWLLLAALNGAEPDALPPAIQDQLMQLFEALGLAHDTQPDELQAIVSTWPKPDPAIINEINRALRELLQSNSAELGQALSEVIGSDKIQGVLGRTAPPPKGTVAGGPLGRLAHTKLDG